MSTPAGDNNLGDANIRINANTDPAIRALGRLSRDADGRLRDIRGRFVSESVLINNALTTAAGGGDRFNTSIRSITDVAGRATSIMAGAGRALASLGSTLGTVGAAAGTAAPLLAGIVTTLESIAPAGAVAVTGLFAVVQAGAAVKLGMVGIEDAVSAAFTTGDKSAEKFAETLENLAPNARAFAERIREMAPALREFQQGVQDRLFAGFADELGRLSSSVLPVVRTNINTTAATLNKMALGASAAARQLATDGTLGKAMAGANKGLSNLQKIPAQVVTGLGQLGAAAAPAFDRITKGAAGVATRISEQLTQAFKSGALEEAIDTAIDVIKDLGTVAGNVFGILGNIMRPVQEEGGGLVGVLLEITGALREATATQGFQDAIRALASVMATLARTAGPLLGQALAALGPIFTTLGPPIEGLITSLGGALGPVITALGPILAGIADAVGIVIDAFAPLLPVIGQLITGLLGPLTPLLTTVGDLLASLSAPVLLLAEALTGALQPILAQLPTLIQPFTTLLGTLAENVVPILADLMIGLAPTLARVGQAFGDMLAALSPLLDDLGAMAGQVLTDLVSALAPVLALVADLAADLLTQLAPSMRQITTAFLQLAVAVGPLVGILLQLASQVLVALLPLLTPLINIIGLLAAAFAGQLASTITNVVIPAVELITALLSGDASAAWTAFKNLIAGAGRFISETVTRMVTTVRGILNALIDHVRQLPGRTVAALAALGGGLFNVAKAAWERFTAAVLERITANVRTVQGLPARFSAALSTLGPVLAGIGKRALDSMRNAITERTSALIRFMSGIPGQALGALGNLGSLLYNSGQSIIQGLIDGIRSMAGRVKDAVGSVLSSARDLLPFSPAKEGPFSGRGWTLFSGQSISEALAEGIAQRAGLVQRAVRSLAEAAQAPLSMPVAQLAEVPQGRDLGVGQVASRGAVAPTVVNVTLNFTNEGVMGSQFEVQNWLARSLEDLQRLGRVTSITAVA